MIWKSVKWAYGDSVRIVLGMLAFAAFVGLLMTFIAYPIEVLTVVLLGFAFLVIAGLVGTK